MHFNCMLNYTGCITYSEYLQGTLMVCPDMVCLGSSDGFSVFGDGFVLGSVPYT